MKSTYPSHHVTEYDHEILHHVASDCHLLYIMVIDWQIVLVCAVSQHFGSWLTVISVFQLLQVFQLFISPQAIYCNVVWRAFTICCRSQTFTYSLVTSNRYRVFIEYNNSIHRTLLDSPKQTRQMV